MTKPIPVRLTEQCRTELRAISKVSGIPVSTLIRNAIAQTMPEYREGRLAFPVKKNAPPSGN